MAHALIEINDVVKAIAQWPKGKGEEKAWLLSEDAFFLDFAATELSTKYGKEALVVCTQGQIDLPEEVASKWVKLKAAPITEAVVTSEGRVLVSIKGAWLYAEYDPQAAHLLCEIITKMSDIASWQ